MVLPPLLHHDVSASWCLGLGWIHHLIERILCTSHLSFVDQQLHCSTLISLAKAAGVLKYAFFTLSHSKHPVFFNASPYFRIVFTCQGTSGQMPLKCSLIWPQFRKSIYTRNTGNYSAPPLLRTLRVLRCGRTERFHRLSAPWNRSDPSDKQAYLTGSWAIPGGAE